MKKVLLLAVNACMISATLASYGTAPNPPHCWAPARRHHQAEHTHPSAAARRVLWANNEETVEERLARVMPQVLEVVAFVQEQTGVSFDPEHLKVVDARALITSLFPAAKISELVEKAQKARTAVFLQDVSEDANNVIALVHDWAKISLIS